MNKKRLIFIIAALVVAAALIVCGIFVLKNTDNDEKNDISVSGTNADTENVENIENAQNNEADSEKAEKETPNETKEGINAGNGPVLPIPTEGDITEKIDKFNSLEDGDPEKEKIREELEALFEYAEGQTIE